VKVAIVHGLKNAGEIADKVAKGECEYDFIEVMSCPQGCINGGGQPINRSPNYKQLRTKGIFNAGKMFQLHKSQDNVMVSECYQNHLGEVGGHKAHHLLHTKYKKRN
jgi:NADH-quinone oxidoreductase subunit G